MMSERKEINERSGRESQKETPNESRKKKMKHGENGEKKKKIFLVVQIQAKNKLSQRKSKENILNHNKYTLGRVSWEIYVPLAVCRPFLAMSSQHRDEC